MGWKGNIKRAADLASEAVSETLWPTRCAICDRLGQVLCEQCRANLPYVDWWKACRTCGSPFGLVQCELCNPVGLGRLGFNKLPFDGCASAVCFDDDTGKLVRVFKDQGEQRLAREIACLLGAAIPPTWRFEAVTFVPATLAAARHRGYDHAELIAQELCATLNAECASTLERPRTRDQRQLGGAERIANLAGSFAPRKQAGRFRSLLLVDDVFTTGATLCAASQALREAGIEHICCLTFARV